MGVRFPFNFVNSAGSITLVTTTNTAVVVLPPFSPPVDGATIIVICSFTIQYGTGTTSCAFLLVRGAVVGGTSLTGASGSLTKTAVAGNFDAVTLCTFDQPGIVGGQQYAMTIQQVGATANGTVSGITIMAFAL